MKIFWPWRRSKTLSLFEEPVPWPPVRSSVGGQRISPSTPDQPHPRNAPGPFYVVNKDCMFCGYPHLLAPDLMAWERDSAGRESHCYFRKQPETPREIEQAINAVNGSCCGALRYAGPDPEIISRIS